MAERLSWSLPRRLHQSARSNRRRGGYTVPLASPVCSMISIPKTLPSAKSWRYKRQDR